MESDVDNDAVHEGRRVLQLIGLKYITIYIALNVFWPNLIRDGYVFLNHTCNASKILWHNLFKEKHI